MVSGVYWEAQTNADYGASIRYNDESKNTRNSSGDLVTDRGNMFKTLSLNLSMMPVVDRDNLAKTLIQNGIRRPVFVSLYPENLDGKIEQMHSILGKVEEAQDIVSISHNRYVSGFVVNEV